MAELPLHKKISLPALTPGNGLTTIFEVAVTVSLHALVYVYVTLCDDDGIYSALEAVELIAFGDHAYEPP